MRTVIKLAGALLEDDAVVRSISRQIAELAKEGHEILDHTGIAEGSLVFTTHLLPLARGILSTIYVTLKEAQRAGDIEAMYRKFYADRKMVRIWPGGKLPELQHVAHTNFADIGFALDKSGRRLIVVSCLDNLGKGAAGQAVQNFNHMLGIEEHTALQ